MTCRAIFNFHLCVFFYYFTLIKLKNQNWRLLFFYWKGEGQRSFNRLFRIFQYIAQSLQHFLLRVSIKPKFFKTFRVFCLITVYAGQMIWWFEKCLCQPMQNTRCVHGDLLRTTHEPQMHKHRNSNVICHLFPVGIFMHINHFIRYVLGDLYQ